MSASEPKLWWLSWYQPTADHHPMTYPPMEAIRGWWCTGYRGSDGAATLVAMVETTCEEAAKAIIQVEWPEATEWRFCEESDGKPPGDRFPLSDWMKKRFGVQT